MLTLEIRFLTGRYAAGMYNDPKSAEWPPHPARVYSALTAALYDDPELDDDARGALNWLAQAGAPEVIASDANERRLKEVYVPTNDTKALSDIDRPLLDRMEAAKELALAEREARSRAEKKLGKAEAKLRERSLASAEADGKGTPKNASQLLDSRPRQPRHFPVALPEEDTVHLRWAASAPAPVSAALDRLCGQVARLGHSSSLVSMRLTETEIRIGRRRRWVPDPSGDQFLRVPLPDQLRLLDEAHERFQQIEPRVLPADDEGSWYRLASDDGAKGVTVGSSFSDAEAEWIVYEVVSAPDGGRRHLLDLSLAQQVTRALRGTLLTALGPGAPEALSGHDSNGRPTALPHLAFVALGDVGHPFATGTVLGVAIVPPRDLPMGSRDVLLEAIFRAETTAGEGADLDRSRRLTLTLGRRGVVCLRRLREPSHRRTLLAGRWCRPARRWVTATAVALGRNPGNLRARDPRVVDRAIEAAERTVAEACVNIGLPEPVAVWIHRRSLLDGAAAAERFMPFPEQGDGPRRVCVHAEIVFGQPVRGPVLLGAGRFFGLGLCAPSELHPGREDRR